MNCSSGALFRLGDFCYHNLVPNKPSHRLPQLAEEIAHQVTIFLQGKLGEAHGIVTCTHVDLDADLRHGRAWISFYPQVNKDALGKILAPHKHELSEHLQKRVPAKWLPVLTFETDTGEEAAQRVNRLIDQL